MKHLDQRCESIATPYAYLDMDFDERQKARSRVVASNGESVGVHIERGSQLKDGDCLRGASGHVFTVRAKREPLSIVRCDSPVDLARAAYHLGNRHVRLQVGENLVLFQTDHVLDEMLRHFGLVVEHGDAPFEPEPGAYHSHAHGEGGASGHGHSHEGHQAHSHADAPSHTHSESQTHSHDHGHSHNHGHSHSHANADCESELPKSGAPLAAV